MPTAIPDRIRQLILDHLPTVERLEILLLLYEARDHGWTVEEIEEQIRSRPESIRRNLSGLVSSRLVVTGNESAAHFRYHGGRSHVDQAVAELETVYRRRRLTVIQLVYTEQREAARQARHQLRTATRDYSSRAASGAR